MRHRLLTLCLLAYPRARRGQDGTFLRDLALELSERSGVLPQALSMVRGGLAERVRGVRRRAALVVVAVVAIAAGALALGGAAVADHGSVEVEARSCSGHDCAALEAWAADQKRDGWRCERTSSVDQVSWQCTRP